MANTRNAVALILAAYPRRAAATRAAKSLVRDGVLACATVHAGATAHYRWEGRPFAEPSVILWGKCAWSRSRAAVAALKATHPDRVPEILAIRVAHAWPAYAAWVAAAAPRTPRKKGAR